MKMSKNISKISTKHLYKHVIKTKQKELDHKIIEHEQWYHQEYPPLKDK